jgi:hypothetical protein
MTSRKFDEVASNVDDAKTTADELQNAAEDATTPGKIDELKETLDRTSRLIDEIADADDDTDDE